MTSVWMDGCARYRARGQFLTEVCTLPTHAAYSGSQTSQKVLGLRDLGGLERLNEAMLIVAECSYEAQYRAKALLSIGVRRCITVCVQTL